MRHCTLHSTLTQFCEQGTMSMITFSFVFDVIYIICYDVYINCLDIIKMKAINNIIIIYIPIKQVTVYNR